MNDEHAAKEGELQSSAEMQSELSTPAQGLTLALSGGGSRAALFHLGVLWYLSVTGRLESVSRVHGVSGGAIVAAFLLRAGDAALGPPAGFNASFARPLLRYLRSSPRLRATLRLGWMHRGIMGFWHRRFLDEALGRSTIGSLKQSDQSWRSSPAAGEVTFLFGTSDLESGRFVEFSVGGAEVIEMPLRAKGDGPLRRALFTPQDVASLHLGHVVAWSSAYPPVFPAGVFRAGRCTCVLVDGGLLSNTAALSLLCRDGGECLFSDASGGRVATHDLHIRRPLALRGLAGYVSAILGSVYGGAQDAIDSLALRSLRSMGQSVRLASFAGVEAPLSDECSTAHNELATLAGQIATDLVKLPPEVESALVGLGYERVRAAFNGDGPAYADHPLNELPNSDAINVVPRERLEQAGRRAVVLGLPGARTFDCLGFVLTAAVLLFLLFASSVVLIRMDSLLGETHVVAVGSGTVRKVLEHRKAGRSPLRSRLSISFVDIGSRAALPALSHSPGELVAAMSVEADGESVGPGVTEGLRVLELPFAVEEAAFFANVPADGPVAVNSRALCAALTAPDTPFYWRDILKNSEPTAFASLRVFPIFPPATGPHASGTREVLERALGCKFGNWPPRGRQESWEGYVSAASSESGAITLLPSSVGARPAASAGGARPGSSLVHIELFAGEEALVARRPLFFYLPIGDGPEATVLAEEQCRLLRFLSGMELPALRGAAGLQPIEAMYSESVPRLVNRIVRISPPLWPVGGRCVLRELSAVDTTIITASGERIIVVRPARRGSEN